MLFSPYTRAPHYRTRLLRMLLLWMLALSSGGPAFGADVEKGRRIFQKCASCHVIDRDTNLFGPTLQGIVGRRAGSAANYRYSTAMKAAGEAGLVWDEQALSEFLASPQKKVPGTSMRFWGFWFQSDIDDLIAYLTRP